MLHRLAAHIAPGTRLKVLDPIRRFRDKIIKDGELERDVHDAAIQLAAEGAMDKGCLLVLLDADDDCAATLGPSLRKRANAARPDLKVEVVFAVREFEPWILASSKTLDDESLLTHAYSPEPGVEAIRDAKGMLKERLPGGRYSPTIDQVRLAKKVNVEEACQAPSFRRLYGKLTQLLLAS